MATEWEMQESLTQAWLGAGLEVGDERLFLAAWEVMVESWRVNDSRRHWNEPSIDFLVLDRHGRAWALELKREIVTPRDAWSVLCQVSHRAVVLCRTFTPERLDAAFVRLRAGLHGRVIAGAASMHVAEAHREFFDLPEALPASQLGAGPPGRIVAARAFMPGWSAVLDEFNACSLDALKCGAVSRYEKAKSGREFRRIRELDAWDGCLAGPVVSLQRHPEEWVRVA